VERGIKKYERSNAARIRRAQKRVDGKRNPSPADGSDKNSATAERATKCEELNPLHTECRNVWQTRTA
jgi:hypothetical protein